MAHFLLVHGACHGAWCWAPVIPLLEGAGHDVSALDLPGHGDDRTPLRELSLAAYAAAVVERARSAGSPCVLVGHSMAGAVISRAAETAPELFARLVYLTAYIPQSEQSLAALARRDQEAQTSSERVEIDGVDCFVIPDDVARRAFYQDADDETFAVARVRIGPEPVSVFREKAVLTEANFGRVPRAYIHCTEDRAIGYTMQRVMVQATPCDPVLTLQCGHSPFLTAPAELAAALLSLGE